MLNTSIAVPFLCVIWIMAMSFILNHKRRNCSGVPRQLLLNLPIEILTEILTYLEWDDVLRARQTCRSLQRASYSRSVWLALIKRYMAIIRPRQLWPEKPLDWYTSQELEHLILQWKSIKVGWAANQWTEPIPGQRHFLMSDQSAPYVSPCVCLVEGGRWLLVGTTFGSVQYYDLDALNISATSLIPPPFDGRAEMRISIDMDAITESLTFHLGILTRRRPGGNDPEYPHSPGYAARWIQVWRVATEIDSHGNVKGLKSELKSSFCEEYEPACFSFRIQGQFVTYSLFCSDRYGPFHRGHKIIIVDWTTCTSTSMNYTRKIIPNKASWLALLPTNRLLCYTDVEFILYDLVNAPTTTSLPSQHRQFEHYSPTASLPAHVDAVSQPFFLSKDTRLTILTPNGVKGMTVPHSGDPKLDLVDLLPGDFFGDFVGMGYHFAAIVECWPIITFLQYAWPEERPVLTFFRNVVMGQESYIYDPTLLIDTSSGRVVICGHNQNKQYILGPSKLIGTAPPLILEWVVDSVLAPIWSELLEDTARRLEAKA